ncbi:HAD family hydrolase [Occultella kanbiaonis]|uniref:HAD family hydrolase n=1 Tax=Occultella kanbiaonis TaxID=2675754 RepID=UPI0013D7948F|nr:HAD family hydrolase [Occultella kanbiaonis]
MPDGGADVPRTVIRGVLFDIDDTLVDTRSAFAAALGEVAAEFLPGVPPEDYPRLLATWRADTGRHYQAFTRGEIGHLDQRRARVDQLHEVYDGATLDDATFLRWNERYDEAFERAWTAFDDAVPTVTAARRDGLRTGSLSNALAAMQRVKLAVTGLDSLAPLLVSLDTFGVGKPDPRVFLEACRLLGTAPEETIYVGDELDTDGRGAQRAGLRGVWLDRPGGRRGGPHDEDPAGAAAEGIAVISGLGELPALWS